MLGQTNTPALSKFVDQIKEMIDKQMKGKVLDHKTEEQASLGAVSKSSTVLLSRVVLLVLCCFLSPADLISPLHAFAPQWTAT